MKTLIQINQDYIIVDDQNEIRTGDWILQVNDLSIFPIQIQPKTDISKYRKIIASTNPEHNVPLISSIEEALQTIKDKEIGNLANDYSNSELHPYKSNLIHAFYSGYKSNKAEYTREQMIEAMNYANRVGTETALGATSKVKWGDEYLQSITPPIQPTNVEVEDHSFYKGEVLIYTNEIKITNIL